MKKIKTLAICLTAVVLTVCAGCTKKSVNPPEYRSEISMDEDCNITDMGRDFMRLPGGVVYYHYGTVTLYDTDGGCKEFDYYLGTEGLEKGSRGVIDTYRFYNLDRNEWVRIGRKVYRASGIVD